MRMVYQRRCSCHLDGSRSTAANVVEMTDNGPHAPTSSPMDLVEEIIMSDAEFDALGDDIHAKLAENRASWEGIPFRRKTLWWFFERYTPDTNQSAPSSVPGEDDGDVESDTDDGSGGVRDRLRCCVCGFSAPYKDRYATSAFSKHVKHNHAGLRRYLDANPSRIAGCSVANSPSRIAARPDGSTAAVSARQPPVNRFRHALFHLMTSQGLPPVFLECAEFEEFVATLNAKATLPSADEYAAQWIPQMYDKCFAGVIERVQRAQSGVISFYTCYATGTSEHHAVLYTFVTEEGIVDTDVLGFIETGVGMKVESRMQLHEIARTFSLKRRVFAHTRTSDSAGSRLSTALASFPFETDFSHTGVLLAIPCIAEQISNAVEKCDSTKLSDDSDAVAATRTHFTAFLRVLARFEGRGDTWEALCTELSLPWRTVPLPLKGYFGGLYLCLKESISYYSVLNRFAERLSSPKLTNAFPTGQFWSFAVAYVAVLNCVFVHIGNVLSETGSSRWYMSDSVHLLVDIVVNLKSFDFDNALTALSLPADLAKHVEDNLVSATDLANSLRSTLLAELEGELAWLVTYQEQDALKMAAMVLDPRYKDLFLLGKYHSVMYSVGQKRSNASLLVQDYDETFIIPTVLRLLGNPKARHSAGGKSQAFQSPSSKVSEEERRKFSLFHPSASSSGSGSQTHGDQGSFPLPSANGGGARGVDSAGGSSDPSSMSSIISTELAQFRRCAIDDAVDPATWWAHHHSAFPTLWKLARLLICVQGIGGFDPRERLSALYVVRRCLYSRLQRSNVLQALFVHLANRKENPGNLDDAEIVAQHTALLAQLDMFA